MSNFKCPMCTDCPDNCPLDNEEDAREYSADFYRGAREFAEYLDNNGYCVSKTIWNDCGHVEDYLGVYDALAEWQKF